MVIDEKIEEKVKYLYNKEDLSASEINKKVPTISRQKIFELTKLKKIINPETNEPFQTLTERADYLTKKRTNPDTGKPYESIAEYNEQKAEERRKKPEYKAFGNFIEKRLDEMEKSQYWLSKQLDTSRQLISEYIHGKCKPNNQKKLKKLFSTLGTDYKTIDDLMEGQ